MASVDVGQAVDPLTKRIRTHYEVASDYFYSLWGQHIHHGYFKDPNDTKEQAQVNLANKLLEISALGRGSKVLDVGCGIGGTTRLLAKTHGCTVTGITISGHQVNMARRLTAADVNSTSASKPAVSPDEKEFMHYPDAGATRFIELDAHEMGKHFEGETFDCIWICEALYHLRDKDKFFSAAYSLLAPGGSSFVLAEWFKAPNLSEEQEKRDIAPIEAGMLSQRLCTIDDYLRTAEKAGFRLRQEPINISSQVAKTWDVSWKLAASPTIWAYALWQGRDGIGYLQGIRAMKRGYANGSFIYAVMCFEKV